MKIQTAQCMLSFALYMYINTEAIAQRVWYVELCQWK